MGVQNVIKNIKNLANECKKIRRDLEYMKIAIGRIEEKLNRDMDISDCEFKVFSQWGEDGIIAKILQNVPIERKIFVEFGVEDYTECNTRFLLMNDNWSGLIIDGDENNMKKVRSEEIYWRYNLKAVSKFITKENINEILTENGIQGDIGILSVDIDGNDYWVWEAINVISPRIVICEYNSLFGAEKKVTTPYEPNFIRSKYDESNLIYGASICALTDLAEKKGYSLVAGNSACNNIFFVRNDLMENMNAKAPQDVYGQAQFREERKASSLTYNNFEERKNNVENSMIFDLDKNTMVKLKDI